MGVSADTPDFLERSRQRKMDLKGVTGWRKNTDWKW